MEPLKKQLREQKKELHHLKMALAVAMQQPAGALATKQQQQLDRLFAEAAAEAEAYTAQAAAALDTAAAGSDAADALKITNTAGAVAAAAAAEIKRLLDHRITLYTQLEEALAQAKAVEKYKAKVIRKFQQQQQQQPYTYMYADPMLPRDLQDKIEQRRVEWEYLQRRQHEKVGCLS
jgi:hypothetical protein